MAKTTTAKKTVKKRIVKVEAEGQAHILASLTT
jgi:hypothetical protein